MTATDTVTAIAGEQLAHPGLDREHAQAGHEEACQQGDDLSPGMGQEQHGPCHGDDGQRVAPSASPQNQSTTTSPSATAAKSATCTGVIGQNSPESRPSARARLGETSRPSSTEPSTTASDTSWHLASSRSRRLNHGESSQSAATNSPSLMVRYKVPDKVTDRIDARDERLDEEQGQQAEEHVRADEHPAVRGPRHE